MQKVPHKIGKLLGVTIASLAVTVAMSTSASAGSDGPVVVDSSGYKARGVFLSYGDHIRVSDDYADGKSAVVLWNDPTGEERRCWDSNGALNGMTDCNYNLQEGAYVHYEVCLGEYGSRQVHYSTCGESGWGYA